MYLSPKIKAAVDKLVSLPGIGPRQAVRLAYFLARSGGNRVSETASALNALGEMRVCRLCFFVHENGLNNEGVCEICSDPSRSDQLVAIVEKETDLLSLEKTGRFSGHYLVLGDLKKSGVLGDLERQRIESFKSRLAGRKIKEIILALSPTAFGDFNASMLQKELAPFAETITRLGRGIPIGGEIEFADPDTLTQALKNRS